MTERYISVTDDEYVYFLDTESKDYKTLENFEKKEFETAKKDNIDIKEYEDAILQSAGDKYWDYVYEYHVEANVVCDILNEQDNRIKELLEENEQLKETIKELEAQLYCDPDGGVCMICDNEYLVEVNNVIDGHYYHAKCKKGHDGCSSDVIYHCKDFKLKSDMNDNE